MDYDLESALLVKALKDAEANKSVRLNTGMPADRMVGGRYVAPGMGELMNAFVTPSIGGFQEQQAIEKQRKLNEMQDAEVTALQQELATPGTKQVKVLKRTLDPTYQTTPGTQQSNMLAAQDEGLVAPTETTEQRPLDPLNSVEDAIADNQRRMEIAQKMFKLPKARGMAEELWKKGIAFPEKLAELRAKQIEAGNQNAMRLQEKARSDELYRLTAETQKAIADERTAAARQAAQAKADAAQGKIDAAKEKADREKDATATSLERLEEIVTQVKTTPNLKSALGAFESRLPGWASITPSEKSTAASRIKNLQEYLQTKGLEDLRRAGVAPGSVTEKEWAKFAARAGNIDPNLDEASFNNELDMLLKDIKETRDKLGIKYKVREVQLKEGRTGVEWSDGSRTIK